MTFELWTTVALHRCIRSASPPAQSAAASVRLHVCGAAPRSATRMTSMRLHASAADCSKGCRQRSCMRDPARLPPLNSWTSRHCACRCCLTGWALPSPCGPGYTLRWPLFAWTAAVSSVLMNFVWVRHWPWCRPCRQQYSHRCQTGLRK